MPASSNDDRADAGERSTELPADIKSRSTKTARKHWLRGLVEYARIPPVPLTIILAAIVGVLGGFGAALFTALIETVSRISLEPALTLASRHWGWVLLTAAVPAIGILVVAAFTRRFAPEAEGHGVPEVITAVARNDGLIRPRVALVKILASGICIGTGGSVGREGPIVQIGSALGSLAGQLFGLSAQHLKMVVAAGAAAGISATFHAPLAGVVFSSEVILGSFAVESMTPIVVAAVLADVVQTHVGEHGLDAAFPHINYAFAGAWEQIPSFVMLGLMAGLAAVSFTKMVYAVEDVGKKRLPHWGARALVLGLIVGLVGAFYPATPPHPSEADQAQLETHGYLLPPLFGVGYGFVDHALNLQNEDRSQALESGILEEATEKHVKLDPPGMWRSLLWILPLVFLKPLLTSLTLAAGGSGGIFAPSLFLGAGVGAAFGLLCNLAIPAWSANPGVYAIVGMGAVVAGTTHGVLSAILIVYEMTGDYRIILPIMIAAGLSSVMAKFIDPESIYYKKLSRRGELISRGHDMHRLDHIMVRDVMIRHFPTVRHTDNVTEIVRVARANSHIETLPVMDDDGRLLGIIRAEDLHRILDSDISPHLVQAEDIALPPPLAVSPNENLLEALRDFGTRDIETLPVESKVDGERRIVGLLLRADVMRRYRIEMLRTRV